MNNFIDPLLEKLATEKKEIMPMDDYNINILSCNSDNESSIFIDAMQCMPINTPTWITATSKTLIDNIFYNTFTKNILAGNITTSISDHLTQFLITTNKNSLP